MPDREPFTNETPDILLQLPLAPFYKVANDLNAEDLVLLAFAMPPHLVLPDLRSRIGCFEIEFRFHQIVVKIGLKGNEYRAALWKFHPLNADEGFPRVRYNLRLAGQVLQVRECTPHNYSIFTNDHFRFAVSFASFLRRAFGKKLTLVQNNCFERDVCQAMITLPRSMDCDVIESMGNRFTNDEFNRFCLRFNDSRDIHLNIFWTPEEIQLTQPITSILHITISNCAWFGREQLLNLHFDHTRCVAENITAIDFNDFLENWLQGRLPKVKSLVITLNRRDPALFVGFANFRGRFPEDHRYKSIRGFVDEQRYWPLISLRREDGVFASVYRETGGVQFVVWEAIPI